MSSAYLYNFGPPSNPGHLGRKERFFFERSSCPYLGVEHR